MDPDKLLAAARDLVHLGIKGNRVTDEYLRRSVSTIYYALFQCLSRSNADTVVGGPRARRGQDEWNLVYRAMDHGKAPSRCRRNDEMKRFPVEIQRFANLFCIAQEQRTKADYDPNARFSVGSVLVGIMFASSIIQRFSNVPRHHRRAFAVYLLIDKTKG